MKKYLVLVSLFFMSFINAYDRISLGSYAHYNSKPEHDNKPLIFTYDTFNNEKNFYGIALFNNSFGISIPFSLEFKMVSTMVRIRVIGVFNSCDTFATNF